MLTWYGAGAVSLHRSPIMLVGPSLNADDDLGLVIICQVDEYSVRWLEDSDAHDGSDKAYVSLVFHSALLASRCS